MEGSGFPVAVQVREMLNPSRALVARGGTMMTGGVGCGGAGREGGGGRNGRREREYIYIKSTEWSS